MSGECGMSMSDPWSQIQGSQGKVPKRHFGQILGIAVLASFCLLAGLATSAQASTVSLYASPSGTGDCGSPASACSITTAVTGANAASIADSVRIKLAAGTYPLAAPEPTALPITFAGPSLTLEADGGTPILNGTKKVRLLSVSAASNVTIDGLVIEFGETTGLGGGIENAGKLAVRNSTFAGNNAGNGGAISNAATGVLTVENSTFAGNTTTGVGGGAIIDIGAAAIERSTIVENTAPINGGGVNVQTTGTLRISSSTITGNTSGSLGGGLSNLGTLNVLSSTLAGNTGSDGAAIGSGNKNVTLAADIIAENTAKGLGGGDCNPSNTPPSKGLVDGGYNLDDDGTCVSAATPAAGSHSGTTTYGSSTYGAVLDAYLADGLASNGGPTQTIALLSSPNPATTMPDPAYAAVPPSFLLPVPIGGVFAACSVPDQRGLPRRSPCDIGAFEIQPTPPPPPPAAKPSLTALKLAPKKLRKGQKATISFKLDVGATVTFQLKRKVRKHGKVKLVKSGGAPAAITAAAGNVKQTWKPKGLALGKYQLQATPAAGAVATFNFKIVAKHHHKKRDTLSFSPPAAA